MAAKERDIELEALKQIMWESRCCLNGRLNFMHT